MGELVSRPRVEDDHEDGDEEMGVAQTAAFGGGFTQQPPVQERRSALPFESL